MITIVFFHNTSGNIFSRIIEWFEGSTISHCAIGLTIDNTPYLLHSSWGGVALIPRSEIMGNHTVVAEFQVLPDVSNEVEAAKKRVGEGYDVLTLFGYIPVILGRHLHIGIHNPFYSKSAEVCSEFVVEVDTRHLIHEFDGSSPADIDPEDLFDICAFGKSFQRIA